MSKIQFYDSKEQLDFHIYAITLYMLVFALKRPT